MVNMSSSACVGCAWRPSPALTTWMSGATWRAIRCAAPDCEWRTTNMSACIAQRLSTVSSRVSPLLVEDEPMLRLTTSADRRLAAISKVVRVRVGGIEEGRRAVEDVAHDARGQALGGQQVLELTMFVQLGIVH